MADDPSMPIGVSGRAGMVAAAVVSLIAVAVLLIALPMIRDLMAAEGAGNAQISSVSFGAFLQAVTGQWVTTDFQVDYAAAVALRHGEDPYAWSSLLFDRYGMPSWDVFGPDPHPPTMVALALPFAFLSYQNALSAWSILMVAAAIGTLVLMGVRSARAVPLGLAVCLMFPGAYGIGNPVLVIGLGVAVAHRFRDRPALAALGIALAAAPKISGLILVLPFLLTARWRVLGWAVAFTTVLAAVPVALFPGTWSGYLSVGLDSIAGATARGDNAAVLNFAAKLDVPSWLTVGLVVTVAVLAALSIRDTFWPIVWLMVALLPVAWMYSLLTFIPLFCAAVRRPNPWGVGAVILAAGLTVASPPLGIWPTAILPIVVILAAVAMLQIREHAFWPNGGRWWRLAHRKRADRAAMASGT